MNNFYSFYINNDAMLEMWSIIIALTLVYLLLYKILKAIKDHFWNDQNKKDQEDGFFSIFTIIYSGYLINIWLILYHFGEITIYRIFKFCLVFLLIASYKSFINNFKKLLDWYFNTESFKSINDTALLRFFENLLWIHTFRNPLLTLLRWFENKLFFFIYECTKLNLNSRIINIIYHILYNFTMLNGFKIILFKFYSVLNTWSSNTLYILFYRKFYGMIVNVLIFTNLLTVILDMYQSFNIWIQILILYVVLVLIGFLSNYFNKDWVNKRFPKMLKDLEITRSEVLLTGIVLENLYRTFIYKINFKEMLFHIINKNIYSVTSLSYNLSEDMKCYSNYLYDLSRGGWGYFTTERCWTAYAYKPSLRLYRDVIWKSWKTNYEVSYYLYRLNFTNENDDALLKSFCEYNLLIHQLIVYYLMDIECSLNYKKSLIEVKRIQEIASPWPIWVEIVLLEYTWPGDDYIYLEHQFVNSNLNTRINAFWDLYENKEFYENFYNYVILEQHKHTFFYKTLHKTFQSSLDPFTMGTDMDTWEVFWNKQLLNWKSSWEVAHTDGGPLDLKFKCLFQKLNKFEIEFQAQASQLHLLNKDKDTQMYNAEILSR